MTSDYKGSTWNKWDLHIHTPLSIEQHYGGDRPEVWEKFISDLEKLPDYYKVLGINDYFTIKGYNELVKFQKSGRLQGRILLPVIELRVKAFGNLNPDDAWKRVNLHVIFNNNNIDEIYSQFLNLLKYEYSTFNKTGLNESSLIEFGQSIINATPVDKRTNNSAREVGFHNLNFDHRKVENLLKKSGLDYFIATGKAEWGAMRWDGSVAEKRDVIERSHFIFTASENILRYKTAISGLIKESVNNPLFDCSDAHSFSNAIDKNQIAINTRIGNCFSWIKADTTFEGLRQICHEPNSRLRISETEPSTPPLRINSITLQFPGETEIMRKEDGSKGKSSEFCLGGEISVHFSPYFTCLIGGRGTGKSTILNILSTQLGDKTEFFDKNSLMLKGKPIAKFDEYVIIDGTASEFEFISQNQIERFAESDELTDAIYERLKEDELSNFEKCTVTNIKNLEKQITNLRQSDLHKTVLLNLEQKLSNNSKIVDTFSNPNYKSAVDAIKLTQAKIDEIKRSKERYENLKKALNNLAMSSLPDNLNEPYNEYDEKFVTILEKIEEISSDIAPNEFVFIESELKTLEQQLEINKQSLNKYLVEQGESEDNINVYETAVSQIPILQNEKNTITELVDSIENEMDNFKQQSGKFNQDKIDFEDKIREELKPLNEKLKINNPNLAEIQFEYEFNEEKAKDKLFEDFERQFNFSGGTASTTRSTVRECLFCVEPLNVNTIDDFWIEIEKKNETNAKSYLKTLFEKEVNFEIYKLLIHKNYIDVKEHKKIIGFYGGKELKNCSFGQRCTAVIVALLMFGNKPLIIDEPEAHLDSKLIAEYLVGLIKQRKHERQIIFATHNANFVVNGDAELIQILEVDNNNRTIITSTSIENLAYRNKLLALEGGKDAFERRDKKLLRKL